MLVTDALNVVLSKPVVEKGWALYGFHGTNVCTQSGLQVIAGGQGACGSGRRDEGPGFEFSGALNGIEYGFESGACDSTVDNL